MQCPRCAVALVPLRLERGHAAGCERCEVAYVQIDRCPGHGTWFDARELEFVAKTLVQVRATEQLPPGARYARNADAANAQLHNFVDELELTVVLLAAARRDAFGFEHRGRRFTARRSAGSR